MSGEALIDPPGAFAPMGEWENYLESLRAMPASPEVTAAIKDAEQLIHARSAPLPNDIDLDQDDNFSDLLEDDEGED
jgi:hypothetical protein